MLFRSRLDDDVDDIFGEGVGSDYKVELSEAQKRRAAKEAEDARLMRGLVGAARPADVALDAATADAALYGGMIDSTLSTPIRLPHCNAGVPTGELHGVEFVLCVAEAVGGGGWPGQAGGGQGRTAPNQAECAAAEAVCARK